MQIKLYAALPALLLPWFSENARSLPWRQDKIPYHVWLSEIMLQQTRVEAVRGYYLRFLDAFPDIFALSRAEENAVLKCWEGLGYYSRARNLQKTAKIIAEKYNGIFPTCYDEILALPGIGEYTAGAISSICFEAPTPAVDGNVLRVSSRLTNSDTPVDLPLYKKEVTESLRKIYPVGHCGAFTQSLMELGAMICTPRSPRCPDCPLGSICLAKKHNTATSLPIKTPKKERKSLEKTVFFFTNGQNVAVRKRENNGLLAGLWEFPNVEGVLSPADAVRLAEDWETVPDAPTKSIFRVHIFTHIEWHMTCYYIPCKKMPEAFIWVEKEKLENEIALPTAFKIFWEEYENRADFSVT